MGFTIQWLPLKVQSQECSDVVKPHPSGSPRKLKSRLVDGENKQHVVTVQIRKETKSKWWLRNKKTNSGQAQRYFKIHWRRRRMISYLSCCPLSRVSHRHGSPAGCGEDRLLYVAVLFRPFWLMTPKTKLSLHVTVCHSLYLQSGERRLFSLFRCKVSEEAERLKTVRHFTRDTSETKIIKAL